MFQRHGICLCYVPYGQPPVRCATSFLYVISLYLTVISPWIVVTMLPPRKYMLEKGCTTNVVSTEHGTFHWEISLRPGLDCCCWSQTLHSRKFRWHFAAFNDQATKVSTTLHWCSHLKCFFIHCLMNQTDDPEMAEPVLFFFPAA